MKQSRKLLMNSERTRKGADMEYTNMLAEYNDILKPEDVQKILRTGRNTVYNYLKNGTIKSIMIGGRYKIPKLYLLEFMYPDMIFVKEAI